MRAFVSGLLLVLLIGVASAFFSPAVPHQVENGAPAAMNVDLFGLDNPGKNLLFAEQIVCMLVWVAHSAPPQYSH